MPEIFLESSCFGLIKWNEITVSFVRKTEIVGEWLLKISKWEYYFLILLSAPPSFPKVNFSGLSSGLTSSSYSLCALGHLLQVTTWYKIDKDQQWSWWLECGAVIKGNLGFSVSLFTALYMAENTVLIENTNVNCSREVSMPSNLIFINLQL